MKKSTIIFLAFLFCIFFVFCAPKQRRDSCNDASPQYNRVKEIGSDSLEFYIYNEIKDFESDLQLSQIECTRDSIQIRIWLGLGTYAKHYVWDCHFKDRKWTGYRFVYEEDQSGSRVVAKLVDSDWFRPGAGWDMFSKELLSLDIENKESSLKFGFDQTFLAVEISKGTRYTFYVDVPEESELATKLFDLMKTNLEFRSEVDNE